MMTRAAAPKPLAAAGLPTRWSGAAAFTVLDLDLGDGGTLIDALLAWRDDPARCARLRWAALASRAPSRAALAAALAARAAPPSIAEPLLARRPPDAPGVHRIELEGGRVRIAIAVGTARTMLPGWVPHADALLVAVRADAAQDAQVLRTAGATLVAGGVAGIVAARDAPRARVEAALAALSAAGLACAALDPPPGGGCAWRATRTRGRAPTADGPASRHALVVGAGLAGAAAGAALSRRGWSVVRVDAGPRDDPRQSGSLQPVLAQHPSVTPDDAPLSRLTRAATLLAAGVAGADALRPIGRLQCVDAAFAERAARGLPGDWVRAVDAHEASALAGVRLNRGGLWLPRACAAEPRALRDAWTLGAVREVAARRVERLEPTAEGWLALDADGTPIAESPVVVLACGAGEVAVASPRGGPAQPPGAWLGPAGLRRRLGATTVARPGPGQRPACIVGGDGHVVPIDADTMLLGPAPTAAPGATAAGFGSQDPPATHDPIDPIDPIDPVDPKPSLRAWHRWAAHLAQPGRTPALHAGPTGTRLSTRDHLPIAGAVPDPQRLAARDGEHGAGACLPGLWIATALGGRGLLWSVLCAELIAASLEREPAPIERALARQLAADRFLARARRRPDTSG